MQSSCETFQYSAKANKLLREEERNWIVDTLARNPTLGDLIRGSGGIRKLRVALAGAGKSGGARVLYYYHDAGMPIFLLYLFAKNERENLTKADLAAWADAIADLKSRIRKKGK